MEAQELAILFPLRNESCDTLTQNNIDYAVELIEEDRKEQRNIGREEEAKRYQALIKAAKLAIIGLEAAESVKSMECKWPPVENGLNALHKALSDLKEQEK